MGKWSQPTARKVLAVKPSLNCSCWREHTFSCWMSLSFWILASTLRSWGSITTALRSSRSGRFRAGASLGLEAKGRPFCNCLGITKGLNFFRFRSIGCGIKQHNKQRGVCQQEEKTRQKDFNALVDYVLSLIQQLFSFLAKFDHAAVMLLSMDCRRKELQLESKHARKQCHS